MGLILPYGSTPPKPAMRGGHGWGPVQLSGVYTAGPQALCVGLAQLGPAPASQTLETWWSAHCLWEPHGQTTWLYRTDLVVVKHHFSHRASVNLMAH